MIRRAESLSQYRRRRGADPQERLRRAATRRRLLHPAPHHGGLCQARQFRRGRDHRSRAASPISLPRLVTEEGLAGRAAHSHPGDARSSAAPARPSRPRSKIRELLPEREYGEARHAAGQASDPGPANAADRTASRRSPPIRRWGSRRICWCSMAAPRSSQRDAGDLRRGAHAAQPRGQRRGRAEAPRPSPLVGGIRRPERSDPSTTTPSPGNKAGGLTTILEKSLECSGQGRTQRSGRCLSICASRDQARLRLHGHAGLRPGFRHRPGGGRAPT